MDYVLIIHKVEEYKAWKVIFDNAAQIRKEAGELSFQVLKYAKQSDKIVHFSQWSSIADAKLFFESPEVVQIRIDTGVKTPEFIYLNQLDEGIL